MHSSLSSWTDPH
uniref:Uncharacterized protein n=1 Tax=Anguilla anguilla TaxID=7936 RepID=A0A0E9S5X6_ANGAN